MEYITENVRCEDLLVDYDLYQRPLESRVNSIAKNWDIRQARPLVLSLREDGSLWVIDGNHTRTAALKVYGEDAELPAIIYDGLTPEDEAELFRVLNTNNKKPTYGDLLKARYAKKEKDVVDYIDSLNASGVAWTFGHGGSKRGPFVGHSSGIKCFKKYGSQVFTSAMRVLANTGDKQLLFAKIVGGVCKLLAETKLKEPDITAALRKATKDDIVKRTRYYGADTAHMVSDENDRVYALVILDYYNKGKRNKVYLENI